MEKGAEMKYIIYAISFIVAVVLIAIMSVGAIVGFLTAPVVMGLLVGYGAFDNFCSEMKQYTEKGDDDGNVHRS